jgi:hypothetical protein
MKQGHKCAFLESVQGEEGSNRPTQCGTRPSPPQHRHPSLGRKQQGKDGAKGVHPKRARPGRGRAPWPLHRPSLLVPTVFNAGWTVRARAQGIFPSNHLSKPLYKEGEAPLTHTHPTTWEHTSLHSPPPLFSLD